LASSRDRVEDLIENELVTLPEESVIADAVKVMKVGGISSILVRSHSSSAENPLITGIVTERDILYRVIGGNKGPYKTVLKEVMSSPVVTIEKGSSVNEAMSLMRNKNIRRLMVIKREDSKEFTLGLVTLMSITDSLNPDK
jgi:signal-transduction protein with cAMP-binding, CBS, and nucleotidyltransferase domain